MLAEPENQRERWGEGWAMVEGGKTNGPAWRDSTQSIIFKQKQQARGDI